MCCEELGMIVRGVLYVHDSKGGDNDGGVVMRGQYNITLGS